MIEYFTVGKGKETPPEGNVGFLENLIGPSAEKVWQEVAIRRGGRFWPSSFLHMRLYPVMRVPVDGWPISVDVHQADKMTFTRFRCAFSNQGRFRFHLRSKSLLSNLGIVLGMQDIQVGHPDFGPHEPMFGTDSYVDLEEMRNRRSEFDDMYIIQGENPGFVVDFFRNYRIRDLIRPTQGMRFETKESEIFGDSLPAGFSKLEYIEQGILRKPDRLNELFDLFGESLETLVKLGVTSQNAARIELK